MVLFSLLISLLILYHIIIFIEICIYCYRNIHFFLCTYPRKREDILKKLGPISLTTRLLKKWTHPSLRIKIYSGVLLLWGKEKTGVLVTVREEYSLPGRDSQFWQLVRSLCKMKPRQQVNDRQYHILTRTFLYLQVICMYSLKVTFIYWLVFCVCQSTWVEVRGQFAGITRTKLKSSGLATKIFTSCWPLYALYWEMSI